MTDGPAKRGEARLIVTTVVVVLLLGGLVMGGIYALLIAGDPGKAAECRGWQQVGEIGNITKASKTSPTVYDLGNGCEAAVIVHGGKLVAVKPRVAACTQPLRWVKKEQSFYCRTETNLVPWTALEYWPTRIVRHDTLRDLEIGFGDR